MDYECTLRFWRDDHFQLVVKTLGVSAMILLRVNGYSVAFSDVRICWLASSCRFGPINETCKRRRHEDISV